MKTNDNYEQLKFHTVINTIPMYTYPDQYPMHWHKYIEVIAMKDDASDDTSGVIRINQEDYEIHPGDIAFVWPGELHEIVENKPRTMMAIQFSITVLNEMKDFALFMSNFKNCRLLSFQKTPELNQTMLFQLQQIFALAEEKEKPFGSVEMTICLYEMFVVLGNGLRKRTDTSNLTDNSNNKLQDKIRIACQYIQANCDANLTLETVAEYVGFSTCYFSRCFKKATTYSFVEYLMMQRVKYMQILLTDKELSITDAAYQAGFRSISSLNRVFRQYSGCSPSEYRKYYRANV